MVNTIARQAVKHINMKEAYVKIRYISTVVLVASLTTGHCAVAIPQIAAAATVPATPPADATRAQGFIPGLDDLMTMLIQPRHVKLYYAGRRKNWEVAANELRDLRSAFGRISQLIPRYLGNDVDQAVQAMIAPKMRAMDAAIAAGDATWFNGAYHDLTAACNACHTYMEHAFLAIKVPDSATDSLYPDQEFNPVP